MKKIGLLSDTHGDFPEQVYNYFADVDEIWHAGDIGSPAVTDKLKAFKPLKAVYGNIDGTEIRQEFLEWQSFTVEGAKILMTHIGGKPGKYSANAASRILSEKADVFICGHSHILLVQYDKYAKMLWLNPGACGNKGFHKIKTLLRFAVSEGKIINMEAIELGKRAGNTIPEKK